MPKSIRQIYEGLLDQQRLIAMQCLDDTDQHALFVRCHNFLGDIEKLCKVLEDRPESVCVRSAAHEYQFALSSVLIGQYRHAFGSLRLAMELLVSAIYFSGHELNLRQWENASRDISWGSLTDDENGVFSKPFVKAFHPFLEDLGQKYRALGVATYRECSEFVHGNPARTRPLEGDLQFRSDQLIKWADAVENIRLVAVFLYLFRYIDNSRDGDRNILEKLATDNLWHEEQVRACFESE